MAGIIEQPNTDVISGLRIDVADWTSDATPWEMLAPESPKDATRVAWVPQSMGDQIWVLFEFKSVEERERWESSVPNYVKAWIDRSVIPRALSFGWHVRDFNGFVIR